MVIVDCNVCTEDKELWPENTIVMTEFDYLRGRTPCKCNTKSSPQWKPFQYMVLLKRKLEESDMKILGDSKYEGRRNKTIHIFSNISGMDFWVTPSHILSGRLPKKEKGYRKSLDWKHEALNTLKVLREDIEVLEVLSKHEVKYRCPSCSTDKYSKSGLCTGIFQSNYHALKVGKISCRCNNLPLTKGQQQCQLEELLKEDEFQFEEYLSSYEGVNTIFTFSCPKGHKPITSIRSYLQNRSCKSCARFGLDPEKLTRFYLTEWSGGSENSINTLKFGVTNREVAVRMEEQARASGKTGSILLQYEEPKGYSLLAFELYLKNNLKTYNTTVQVFPDGFSETIDLSIPEVDQIVLPLRGDKYDHIIQLILSRVKNKTRN